MCLLCQQQVVLWFSLSDFLEQCSQTREKHQPAAVDKANASGGSVTAVYLRQPAVAWYQISLDMRPKIKDMLFAANKAVVLTVALVCLQTGLSSFPAVCWLYGVGFIFS